jgi:hypothetical protein
MTTPLQIVKPPALASVPPRALNAGSENSSTAESNLTSTIAIHLMPYETVAKAIFVKANGLPAYYRATGTVAFAYTRQPLANHRRRTDL